MVFVPLEKLHDGMVLAQDVYVFYSVHIMLLRKGQALTEQFIERLNLFDVPGVYVEDGRETELLPDKTVRRPVLDPKLKKKAIHNVENVFNAINQQAFGMVKEDIGQLRGVVSELVDNLLVNRKLYVNITDLKSYDDYTYHHSLSVSLLSVAIGLEMNLPRVELERLGLCSVLHDIGKIMVPIEIINKPSRLTNEEYEMVKKHASLGEEYLIGHHLSDTQICEGVAGHHEKFDGTGYPLGLSARNIPLYSRIISVADVYDALTSNRPYRSPMQPADAAEYLMANCGSFFDIDIVSAFLQKVELYPVGSFVELSNNKKYLVISNEFPMRPVVRSVSAPFEVLDLYHDKQLRNLVITKTYN